MEHLLPESNITVGMGIVSWKSHETLIKTLESYRKERLFDLFDRSVIFFQDLDETDRHIASDFGLEAIGGPNVGIAEGMRQHALHLQTDYVLFMENDCPLIESHLTAKQQLKTALTLLHSEQVDIMRLRHRQHTGQAFDDYKKYSQYFPVKTQLQGLDTTRLPNDFMTDTLSRRIRRTLRPYKADNLCGRSVYVEKEPHKLFPNRIQKLDHSSTDIFVVDSASMNWTNQSVLCSADLFVNKIMPYVDAHPKKRRTSNGFQSPERPLHCDWWCQQHFRIGVGDGLFTHNRFDGSWRTPPLDATQASPEDAL
jgi:hypothetical protein